MAKVIRESGTDKQGLQVDNLQCCIQNHSCSKTANGQKQPKYLGGLYQQHTTTMIQSWYSSTLAPSQNPNLHFWQNHRCSQKLLIFDPHRVICPLMQYCSNTIQPNWETQNQGSSLFYERFLPHTTPKINMQLLSLSEQFCKWPSWYKQRSKQVLLWDRRLLFTWKMVPHSSFEQISSSSTSAESSVINTTSWLLFGGILSVKLHFVNLCKYGSSAQRQR